MPATYPIVAILAGGAASFATALTAATFIGRLGFPLPNPKMRLGCIDGLRGFLATAVLIHHFIVWMQVTRLGTGWSPPTLTLFNQIGSGSVALFFMITGFVFYPRVLAGWRSTSWVVLLMGRGFRLLPMVVLSVALAAVLVDRRTGAAPGPGDLAALPRWVSGWGEPPLLGDPDAGRTNAFVLWSLWYEWLFYLFGLPAAALARDLVRGRCPTWIVPAVMVVFGLPFMLTRMPASLLSYLPLFGAGMLAFEFRQQPSIVAALRTPTATFLASAALVAAFVALPWTTLPGFLLLSVFFTCVACGNGFGGVLAIPAATVLGECSFGIYLLHGCVLSFLFVDLAPPLPTAGLPILVPLTAAAAVLAAAMASVIVERPAIWLGRWFVRAAGFGQPLSA